LKNSQKYGKILVRMFENPHQISKKILLRKRGLDSIALIKILEILFFRMGGIFVCWSTKTSTLMLVMSDDYNMDTCLKVLLSQKDQALTLWGHMGLIPNS